MSAVRVLSFPHVGDAITILIYGKACKGMNIESATKRNRYINHTPAPSGTHINHNIHNIHIERRRARDRRLRMQSGGPSKVAGRNRHRHGRGHRPPSADAQSPILWRRECRVQWCSRSGDRSLLKDIVWVLGRVGSKITGRSHQPGCLWRKRKLVRRRGSRAVGRAWPRSEGDQDI